LLSRQYHRGIAYAVTEIATGQWEWKIFPPESVKGYVRARGNLAGTRTSAINAAKREIETQEYHSLH
jgi:hypothetical protein